MSLKRRILTSILLVGTMVASTVTPAFATTTVSSGALGTINVEGVVGTNKTLNITLPTNAIFALGTITGGVTSKNLFVANQTSGAALKIIANFDVVVAEDVVLITGTGAQANAAVSGSGITAKNLYLGADVKVDTTTDTALALVATSAASLLATEAVSSTALRLQTTITLDSKDVTSGKEAAAIALVGYINTGLEDNDSWAAGDVAISGTYTLIGEDATTALADFTGATAKAIASVPVGDGSAANPYLAKAGTRLTIDVAKVAAGTTNGVDLYVKLIGAPSAATIDVYQTDPFGQWASGTAYTWDNATRTVHVIAPYNSAGERPTIMNVGQISYQVYFNVTEE